MTTARQDLSEELIGAASGAHPLDSEWVVKFGAERVAEAVLAEITGRAALVPGPALATTVQLDLGVAGRRLKYRMVTGAGSITVAPGSHDDPAVTFRQELPELACSVFGPAGRHDHTRELRTRERTGPPAPADLDPVTGAHALGAAATRQIAAVVDLWRPDLTDLAVRFGTDKWGSHWYTPHYEHYFAPLRQARVTLLEIGIGGYDIPGMGGASLLMWKQYFRRGTIHGLDIYDKTGISESRLHAHQGDQGDPRQLEELVAETGPLDIVIDDGSHLNEHVVISFNTLFPHVRAGGLYVIEDTQTAYWPGWGGHDGPQPSTAATSLGLVKTLIDSLHQQERGGGEPASATDLTVTGVHVHHNLVVIEKGLNTEQGANSWIPRDKDPRTLS